MLIVLKNLMRNVEIDFKQNARFLLASFFSPTTLIIINTNFEASQNEAASDKSLLLKLLFA